MALLWLLALLPPAEAIARGSGVAGPEVVDAGMVVAGADVVEAGAGVAVDDAEVSLLVTEAVVGRGLTDTTLQEGVIHACTTTTAAY